jgi:hypothetical protein
MGHRCQLMAPSLLIRVAMDENADKVTKVTQNAPSLHVGRPELLTVERIKDALHKSMNNVDPDSRDAGGYAQDYTRLYQQIP